MKIFRLPLNFPLIFVTFVCFALGFLSLGASQVRAERSLQQVFDDYFGPGVIDTADETGKTTFPAGQYEITLIAKEAGATFAPNGWYPLSNPNQLNQIFPGETTPLTTVEVNIPADYGLWIQTIFGLWKSQPSLNFDGVDHFRVFDIPGGGFAVGIEDLPGGGDWDFQDHVLAFVIKEKVPYFSQIDPSWDSQEYDSGNTLDLWCGSTIAQCGCAVTSAAMLLKYYGVDKSPIGESTNPASLNEWLRTNNGYKFGSVLWPSIAAYSKKSNEKFGTPMVKWNGAINTNNFSLLNNELNNQRPVILEEPGHFIIATGISGSTYAINDPRWSSKITLQAYGNNFVGMRLFAPTSTDLSTIYLTTPTPTQILLIDSLGRRVGRDPNTGEIYNEIPNSFYFLESALKDDTIEDSPLPDPNSGVTTLAIINPNHDTFQVQVYGFSDEYDINFAGYDRNGDITTQDLHGRGEHYILDYSPEPGSQIQVTQLVDVDIKPGSNPNSVNLESNGVIPVAILTTPSFDATQVNLLSVKFGPNQVMETHNKGHTEDVDEDGDIDLVLHFKTQETGIQDIDTQACLTGTSSTGILFEGCDLIQIVPK